MQESNASKKTPFSSNGHRFFFWINHYFYSSLFQCGQVVFLRENKSTSQRISSQRSSPQKRLISSRPTFSAYSRSFCTVWDASLQEDIWIYGLEIHSDQMDFPIISELHEIGQHRTYQNSSDLLVSFICKWGFANTPFPNCNSQWVIIWLASNRQCTVPGTVLYPKILPWDFSCLLLVCSIVWSDATWLKRLPVF